MLSKVKVVLFYAVEMAILLLPIFLFGCGGGSGATFSQASSAGSLTLANNSSTTDVVLHGTHKYVVQLNDAMNLFDPVTVESIINSNEQVADIESNTCLSTDLRTSSCSFYVRGNVAGDTTITVVASNYPPIVESLQIKQQWGSYGEPALNGIGSLYFIESTIYTMVGANIWKLDNGKQWQQIDAGSIITTESSYKNNDIALDDNHICVSLYQFYTVFDENDPDYGRVDSEARCSVNGSAWQTLPATLLRWRIQNMWLYNKTLYAFAEQYHYMAPTLEAIFSCPVDNCTYWQQVESLPNIADTSINDLGFYESTFFFQSASEVYAANNNNIILYGTHFPTSMNAMAVNSHAIALAYLVESVLIGTHSYAVSYNDNSNIGGAFTESVGTRIYIDAASQPIPNLAMDEDSIYINVGDGYVRSSKHESDGSWLPFSIVGEENNLHLYNIFVNNGKLYAINYLSSGGAQLYTYSLSAQ